MKVKKAKKGFTLIELISVVAIILILALIALPSLSGYKEKARTSQTVASAKIVLNAIETYNAEAADKIDESQDVKELLKTDKLNNYIKKGDREKFSTQLGENTNVETLRNFVDTNGKAGDIVTKTSVK
ncbi:type II secretion system protein [Clostridium ihumii]|uniref:type II secretion system protein n=1 Tax=Clostridium ihumii TaxID=1470356 RepID=UPI00058FA494|nr:prepilin-type N-terminal cleavage/methylation domain-containing protein [Clostridium ihumii]